MGSTGALWGPGGIPGWGARWALCVSLRSGTQWGSRGHPHPRCSPRLPTLTEKTKASKPRQQKLPYRVVKRDHTRWSRGGGGGGGSSTSTVVLRDMSSMLTSAGSTS